MKTLRMIVLCLFAMMVANTSLKAQEVTVVLMPGWNWISVPSTDTLDFATALGTFTPMVGDVIVSQWGSASFLANGQWRGTISQLYPGYGYMYKSSRTTPAMLTFNVQQPVLQVVVTTSEPTDITAESAVVGGIVTIDEGNHIYARGVCWGMEPASTIDGEHISGETVAGEQSYTLDSLTPATTYYVRAFVVTDYGLEYGEEQIFTTLPIGAIDGFFSVSASQQVYFSQGNLQYQASTDTWRFAENQWDYVGEDNNNASATYEGWIDLFAWGTSGYDHGAVCYQPWTTGGQYDHAAYAHNEYDLCDENGQADWGYNTISNGGDMEMQWRTCKSSEWHYLLEVRETDSGIRYAKAMVNGINGLVLLPDNWNPSVYALNNTNEGEVSYEVNTISLENWMNILEANGAIFLPAADWSNNNVSTRGAYWTASTSAPHLKNFFDFTDDYMHSAGSYYPHCKYSVRLVRSVAPTSTIVVTYNLLGSGTVTGDGACLNGQSCTLTATPAAGYTFLYWKENGKVVSTANPYTFAVGFDRTLEACFDQTSTYPLLYSYYEEEHTAIVIGHWDGQNASGELVIPETVVYSGETYSVIAVGANAFNRCSGITSVEIPNSVTGIANNAFSGCSGLTVIEIPDSVISIGSGAFNGTSIVSIIIPESVTSLGNQVFYGCVNLTSVTLPSDITSIGYGLFQYCRNLVSITIPDGVTWIDKYAFLDCSGLTSITLLAQVPASIHEQAFDGVNKDIPVYVPCGSLEAYQNAEGWSEFTNYVEMCPDHAYVDLGLPSGLLWATCNVGADNPEDYGDYFAWGETTTKDTYNWSTYQYCNGSYNTLTKYCNDSSYGYNGFTDDLTTLQPDDDAATTNWGNDWRMPTQAEFQELLDNTTVTLTTQNGVNGHLFTASNGNSLFLPAAGFYGSSYLYDVGSIGYYWSSSLNTGNPRSAWILCLNSDNCYMGSLNRGYGLSVRPVRSASQN